MRFLVITARTEKVIEADSLDEAEIKANDRYPGWTDIYVCNRENAEVVA